MPEIPDSLGAEGQVQLEPAWLWTCPSCSTINFAPGVHQQPSEEEHENLLRSVMNLAPWEAIPENDWALEEGWVTAPVEVSCSKCERSYFASALGQNEEGD